MSVLVRDRQREEGDVKTWAETAVIQQRNQRKPKDCREPPETKRGAWNRPSALASKGKQPCDTLILDLWSLELWDNTFLWWFVMGSVWLWGRGNCRVVELWWGRNCRNRETQSGLIVMMNEQSGWGSHLLLSYNNRLVSLCLGAVSCTTAIHSKR